MTVQQVRRKVKPEANDAWVMSITQWRLRYDRRTAQARLRSNMSEWPSSMDHDQIREAIWCGRWSRGPNWKSPM